MKYRIVLVINILLITFLIILCSCEHTNIASNSLEISTKDNLLESTKIDIVAVDENNDDFSLYKEHIKETVNEYLTVDAEIIIPSDFSGSVKEYSYSQRGYDKDNIIDSLNLQIEELDYITDDVYSGKDCYLNLGSGLIFCTEKGKGYSEFTVWPDICKRNEDLSFEARESAERKVLSFLSNDLKMKNELEILNSYVFDKDTEKAYNSIWGGIEDIKTGEIVESYNILEDIEGGYYFEIAEKIDGIIFNTINYEKNGINYPGFLARCIYTDNGIEYLFIDDEIIIDDMITEVTIIDPSQVIACINNKLGKIILSETYLLNEMRLKYYPIDQTKMKIAWEVNLYDGKNNFKVMFDAETGEEIFIN